MLSQCAGWALVMFYGAAAFFMAMSLVRILRRLTQARRLYSCTTCLSCSWVIPQVFIPFVLPALQLAW